MRLELIGEQHWVDDIIVTLYQGHLPLVYRHSDTYGDISKPNTWDCIADISPVPWLKVKVIERITINTRREVIEIQYPSITTRAKDTEASGSSITFTKQSTGLLTAGFGDRTVLDLSAIFTTVNRWLVKHKTRRLSDDDLCLHVVNLIHCDLLSAIQLRQDDLPLLKNMLMKQKMFIKETSESIMTKTSSRSVISKNLEDQRNKFIVRFAHKQNIDSNLCPEFCKILLSHIIEMMTRLSEDSNLVLCGPECSDELVEVMRRLQTLRQHAVCERINASAPSADIHTLLAAASNIAAYINKHQSSKSNAMTAMKRALKAINPQYNLYKCMTASHLKMTNEISELSIVQRQQLLVREALDEICKGLESGNAHADVSYSRTGSTRCTDILEQRVSVRWLRPGELIQQQLANERSKLFQLHKSCVSNISKRCQADIQATPITESLLRSASAQRRRQKLQEKLGEMLLDIEVHFYDISKEAERLVHPKTVSRKVLWLKYEPYFFSKTLADLLLFCDIKNKECFKKLIRYREQATYTNSMKERNGDHKQHALVQANDASVGLEDVDGLRLDDKAQKTETAEQQQHNLLNRLTTFAEQASDLFQNYKPSLDNSLEEMSIEATQEDDTKRRARNYSHATLDMSTVAHESLTNVTQDLGTLQDQQQNSLLAVDDLHLPDEDWTIMVKERILPRTAPASILDGLHEMVDRLSSCSSDLVEAMVLVLVKLEDENIVCKLYTIVMLLDDYLPAIYNTTRRQYALSVVCGAFRKMTSSVP